MEMTVSEIAERLGGTVVGDGHARITGMNGLKEAQSGELSFLADARYLSVLGKTGASAVLVPRNIDAAAMPLIQVDNPFLCFYTLLPKFRPAAVHPFTGIDPTAVIAPSARLGEGTVVGAHVYVAEDAVVGDRTVLYPGVHVGARCVIGSDTVVYPNVAIREEVRVGNRCILHSGVVLGADGFGFVPYNGALHKVPQIGTVILGDDVEIGANSAVDRATFGATVVGRGTKVDNLVQIGHNVTIGEYCTISGSTGISGSTVIGNRVTIAGQVGIAGHLEIGDGAIVGARSGVTKSIPAGALVSGYPAREHNLEKRIRAGMKHLPDALRRIHELERRLAELENKANDKAENDSE